MELDKYLCEIKAHRDCQIFLCYKIYGDALVSDLVFAPARKEFPSVKNYFEGNVDFKNCVYEYSRFVDSNYEFIIACNGKSVSSKKIMHYLITDFESNESFEALIYIDQKDILKQKAKFQNVSDLFPEACNQTWNLITVI